MVCNVLFLPFRSALENWWRVGWQFECWQRASNIFSITGHAGHVCFHPIMHWVLAESGYDCRFAFDCSNGSEFRVVLTP